MEQERGRGASRRTLLAGVGAGVAALALAACADGGSRPAPTPTAAADRSEREKTLRWSGRPAALDESRDGGHPTLADFEKASGIRVRYRDTITDDARYLRAHADAIAAGRDVGADLLSLGDWAVARLLERDGLQRLGRVPHASRLLPGLAPPAFDPHHRHTLPWQADLVGLCWDAEAVPAGLEDVAGLWSERLHGRVGVPALLHETMGLLLADRGVDVSRSLAEDDFMAAAGVLRAQVASGQVRRGDGSVLGDLAAGRTVAAIARSSDVLQLRAAQGEKRWGFALPRTGGLLSVRDFAIPLGSSHRANADALIDHYYDPAVAARVVAWTGTVSPVAGTAKAMAEVDPDRAKEPLLFPDDDTLARARRFRPLGAERAKKYARVFREALLAS